MKLRNKRTGDIWEFDGGFVMKASHETAKRAGTNSGSLTCYANSIAKLNEEWEDYEPAKPLINDEKARKAVRAWAECCCIPLVKHYLSNGLSCFICNDEEDNEYCLDFTFCINNLEAEHIYSITELCGEEEE